MAEDRIAFEFLSKCWVPFIVSEHNVYYAFGNTRMHDFHRDFRVCSRGMDTLVLGLGDVRHVMKTVAGLSQEPFSAGEMKEMRFHLNDVDQDVIARDVILLEIMNKVDPKSKSDAEFLWSVWYNAFIIKKDFMRLKAILGDLIDKYSNSSRDRERICKFGDEQSLNLVLKTWNCWLNRKLNQSSVKQARLKSLADAGCTMSFDDSNIAKYASMQIYIDRGIKESDVETVGREMLTAARDGFVNFSEDHKGPKDFVNPTLMRPDCDEWRVEYSANAAGCYLPLPRDFVDKYSTVHEACFEKMRETISLYLESWKTTKVTYTFWATDLFHLCHWLMPLDMTFDFIFTSNLMDHVGLMNLLLITQPRLKNSQSVLLTESYNWNGSYPTLDEFFHKELKCEPMLLPSIYGLNLAEDLDLGCPNLLGFYRTMYARQSDVETIYWTQSFNQESVQIELAGSPDMKLMLFHLVASTFSNKLYANTASSVRQTPMAAMYCFLRLQHLVRGGTVALLEHVETLMNDRVLDIAINRITWDVVCWSVGLKHPRDRLCMVEIPFKDVNSHLATTRKYSKFSCRLRLDYNTSSNEAYEVLSLFQYDTVSQHFQVPILESAWKALPNHATLSVIGSINQTPDSFIHGLMERIVQVKVEGKVVATYDQPQRIDVSTTDSVQDLVCFEDAEKYQFPTISEGAEIRPLFDSVCQRIVSDSHSRTSAESIEVLEMPYTFSCAVDSYEIKDVGDNHFQAILYKQKTFNVGRVSLPFRLIDDSELLPFTCGQDIKTYLEETMICDLMFCSPNDIESRAKAFSGPVLLADNAFMVLRLVIEQLWYQGSQKDKILNPKIRLAESQANKVSTPRDILILEIEGYYIYGSLPFIRLRFTDVDKNRAAEVSSYATGRKEAETVINVKDCRLLQLVKKMLYTNSLRMSQEISAAQETNALDGSLNSFLQMVFPRDTGEDMKLALHDYPSNTVLVNKYIEKIYSASIRKNSIVPLKRFEIMKKRMGELMTSLTAFETQRQADEKSSAVKQENSQMDAKQELCSECKKSTTDLMKCSRCKSVAYCSKECQVKDWPRHKKNCSSAKPKAKTKSKKEDPFVVQSMNNDDLKKTNETCHSTQGSKDDVSSSKENNKSQVPAKQTTQSGSTEDTNLPCSSAADLHLAQAQSQEMKSNDENDAIPDNAPDSRSVEFCLYCRLEKTNLKKCTNCKRAAYCSRECQRADWKRHRLECQPVQEC